MATYTIPGPDGKMYSINGPAGATKEQVITRVKASPAYLAANPQQAPQGGDPYAVASLDAPAENYSSVPQAPQALSPEARAASDKRSMGDFSPIEQAWMGAGRTVTGLAKGLQDLWPESLGGGLTEKSAQNQQMLENMQSVPATIGEIGGDVAMLAVPATKVAQSTIKATSMLPTAMKVLAATGAEAALVGGYEGAQLPALGESRAVNAAYGAGGTALAPFVGSALKRTLAMGRGAFPRATQASNDLIREGVELTPGQAYGGGTALVENMLSAIPGSSSKTVQMQSAAKDQIKKLYRQKWSEVSMKDVDIPALSNFWGKLGGDLPPNLRSKFSVVQKDIEKDVLQGLKTNTEVDWGNIDSKLRHAIDATSDNALKNTYQNARYSLHDAIRNGKGDIFKSLDDAHGASIAGKGVLNEVSPVSGKTRLGVGGAAALGLATGVVNVATLAAAVVGGKVMVNDAMRYLLVNFPDKVADFSAAMSKEMASRVPEGTGPAMARALRQGAGTQAKELNPTLEGLWPE